MAVDKARTEALIRELLVRIGEDPDREGLQRTPRRMAGAWRRRTWVMVTSLPGTFRESRDTREEFLPLAGPTST